MVAPRNRSREVRREDGRPPEELMGAGDISTEVTGGDVDIEPPTIGEPG